ncbi:MAG: 6-phosphogluconolactonase [Acidobacteriota bacterium]
MHLLIAPPDQLKRELAASFEALVSGGVSNVALTGGASGVLVLTALGSAAVDWTTVTCFWGDERAVAPDHPDSNYGLAHQVLFAALGTRGPRTVRMPADNPDLEAAARDYDAVLEAELDAGPLDLAIVGVGDDGHVCSLFPGHRALLAGGRVVAVTDSPKPPPRRLSLTLPFLNSTREIWIVGIGARKRVVLQQAMMQRERTTPLDLVLQGARNVTVFTDQKLERS